MDPGKLVFAQLMAFVPRHDFDACVRRQGGDSRPRGFSCRDQVRCMAFAQLTFRESLRDIETCLRALERKLYHAGFRARSRGAHWPMPSAKIEKATRWPAGPRDGWVAFPPSFLTAGVPGAPGRSGDTIPNYRGRVLKVCSVSPNAKKIRYGVPRTSRISERQENSVWCPPNPPGMVSPEPPDMVSPEPL
jgi:hypothetical protein